MDAVRLTEGIQQSLANHETRGDTLRIVRQFVLDLEDSDDPFELVKEPPSTTGDPRWDAMVAGVVEDFMFHHGRSTPAWAFEPSRFLRFWWFVTTIDDMRPTAIVETLSFASDMGPVTSWFCQ